MLTVALLWHVVAEVSRVAIPGGLEPPTCWLEVSCSIQLSYGTVAASCAWFDCACPVPSLVNGGRCVPGCYQLRQLPWLFKSHRVGSHKIKNPPFIYFFLFSATIICKIGSIFINTVMAYDRWFCFFLPWNLISLFTYAHVQFFVHGLFLTPFFNAFYFDAFYGQKCYQDNLISGV